jgi:hypothetical protein
MEDVPNFIDIEGFNCLDYADPDVTTCAEFGNSIGQFPDFSDISVNEACIVCGACDVCTGEFTEAEEVTAT